MKKIMVIAALAVLVGAAIAPAKAMEMSREEALFAVGAAIVGDEVCGTNVAQTILFAFRNVVGRREPTDEEMNTALEFGRRYRERTPDKAAYCKKLSDDQMRAMFLLQQNGLAN